MSATRIRGLSARDIRFPTSLRGEGSDVVNTAGDYSCAYVIVFTDANIRGHGLAFTLGRGNELVVSCIKSMSGLIVGKSIVEIFSDFAATWRSLTQVSQLRWIGPEKGVLHLATAAIVNALFDLWARIHQKPMWKFLVDMKPEELVSTIDFRYIEDVLTKEEAIEMLESMQEGKQEREEEMKNTGYPAYTTSTGWILYPEEKMTSLAQAALSEGFTHFKLKVGLTPEEDWKKCAAFREIIGNDSKLMVDANQVWSVNEAIERMKALREFKPVWIEEPTSPDDVLGHLVIKKALAPYGIGVATGEMCQNRVMFKQFLQLGAIDYCQIDSCRLGGVPEVLAVYLMAKKFNVPVCPHGGGVGLCSMIQHLQMWDYICVSGTKKDRFIEYVDSLQEHFKCPVKLQRACYMAPTGPGYSTEMLFQSLADYEYPIGPAWKKLFKKGAYTDPLRGRPVYVESVSVQNDIIQKR